MSSWTSTSISARLAGRRGQLQLQRIGAAGKDDEEPIRVKPEGPTFVGAPKATHNKAKTGAAEAQVLEEEGTHKAEQITQEADQEAICQHESKGNPGEVLEWYPQQGFLVTSDIAEEAEQGIC